MTPRSEEGGDGQLPPVVCVVGWKDSGKTTMVVRLVEELVRRGRRVMTAKHGHGFRVDTPGTDSHRHRHEGGAGRVALIGPDEMAVMGAWGPDGEPELEEVVRRYLADAEVVVAEGWKGGPEPKIEIHRSAGHPDPLYLGQTDDSGSFLAVVTDRTDLDLPIPVLALDDPELPGRLADIVERMLP